MFLSTVELLFPPVNTKQTDPNKQYSTFSPSRFHPMSFYCFLKGIDTEIQAEELTVWLPLNDLFMLQIIYMDALGAMESIYMFWLYEYKFCLWQNWINLRQPNG